MTVNTFFKTICAIFIIFLLTTHNVYAVVLSVTGEVNYSEVWEMLDIINEYRVTEGLKPLTMDSVLMEAAMQRAAECSVYYSHTRPNGTNCFTLIEVRGHAAENAAMDFENPAEAFDGWMNSEGHKVNIVSDKFLSIGIGMIKVDGVKYWTQFFDTGEPRPAEKSTKVKDATYKIDVNDLLLQMNMIQTETIAFHGEPPYNGESVKISGVYTYLNDEQKFYGNEKLLYKSSNPKIVEIDQNGMIRPISTGTAVISIYVKGNENIVVTYNVNITEHIYNHWNVKKQADCVNSGIMESSCEICKAPITRTIPATGNHDCSITSIARQPSCYSKGLINHQCSNLNCDEYYYTEIPETGNHKYDTGVATMSPTSTKNGIKTYSCTTYGCTASYTEVIPMIPIEAEPPRVIAETTKEKPPTVTTVLETIKTTEPEPELELESEEVINNVEIEPSDTPLASPQEIMAIPTDNHGTDLKIVVSIKIIPFILVVGILENIILIIIVKRQNR